MTMKPGSSSKTNMTILAHMFEWLISVTVRQKLLLGKGSPIYVFN